MTSPFPVHGTMRLASHANDQVNRQIDQRAAAHAGRPADLPLRAVLFDLDDTLWPIVPVIRRAEEVLHSWLQQQVPAVAAQWPIARLRAQRMVLLADNPHYQVDLWALRHAGLTAAFLECNADPALIGDAMTVFSDARNDVTLFEDVVPVLTRLGTWLQTGSISNGVADLDTIGLATHFHVSLAAHRFGRAKPDAEIFHAACDKLGVAPSQAVYAGDDLLLDVQAAQDAGLRAVWINRFNRVLPPEIRPDAVCRDLMELEQWLLCAAQRA